MQHAIDIPSPSGADNETVSTALETAALFRSKGDGQEAMRWLRRAAESAGEAGDDERALSLSRVVADLHDELEHAPEPTSAPYPPPPSSRSASSSLSSFRASHPPPPSSRAPRPSLSSPRASQLPRPSARPVYSASTSRPASSVRPASEAVAAPVASSSSEPARAVAPPVSPAKGARHAARVAIEISTTKPGVLEVRLLAEGETPRIGSSEALLVMLDPTSQLLAR